MATKRTTAKPSASRKLDSARLRDLLTTVPRFSKAKLNDEVARALRFLETRPELKARLDSGALTAVQLLAMVRAQAEVRMGESSDQHTRREVDRYLGSDRTG
ncbi:MAG TPA: hypothetical protein PK224_12735 [Nitrospira sp.]|nr:hypothetical protein [Nitrospira sp.]